MSIISKIRSAVGLQAKEYVSPEGETAVNDLAPSLNHIWSKHSFTPITNFNAAYAAWKSNPIAQACTITYSLMMPEAQLGVVTPNGFDMNQPIIQMLTRGQWRTVFGEILTMIHIGGNAYGYKLRNASGAVIGIRWYSDRYFAPVDDGYGDVGYYHYTDGARLYPIAKEDVVHIRGFWYDPMIPLGGASPVSLAYQSIEGFNEAASTVFNIHKNDAVPKTTILLSEEASPEQIDLMSKTFTRRFGGANRGSVGVLWGVEDIKRLALDYNELGLSETFGQFETRICGTYKVHPIIAGTHMGLSQATYSNFEQASKDFTSIVRVPYWNMIADQLNAQLAIPEYDVEIGFDLSTVQALAGEQVAVEGVSTQNSDANSGSADAATPQTASLSDMVTVKGGAAGEAAPFPHSAITIGPVTKAWLQHPDGRAYAKAYDETIQPYADKIARSWSKALMALASELRGTKSLTKAEDFSLDVWTEKFLEETNADREELISLAIRLSQEEVDAEPGEFRRARDEGRRQSSDMIKTSVETLKSEVQQIVADNPLASGDELGKIIYDQLEEFRKPLLPTTKQTRADVIGRTTATATTGVVQKNVWGEIGGIKRSWVALSGARATHDAAHDQPEESDGMFVVGGERTPYPSGPGLSPANSVNCRCFTRARRD